MINGAHIVIYTKDPDADREFFRDVLKLPHVEAGEGWLIFGLPPSEVAFHPLVNKEENGKHEFYLMCEDIEAFISKAKEKGVQCSDPKDQGWGILTQMTLLGGSDVGVYQPRHGRPANP